MEAERWANLAKGHAVGLRVVPDVEAGFHAHCASGRWGTKCGIPLDVAERVAQRLLETWMPVRTLHAHVGVSVGSVQPYLTALERLLARPKDVKVLRGKPGRRPRCAVPLAGRRPRRAADEFSEAVGRRRTAFRIETDRDMAVTIEPGEYLASEAGYLLTSVLVAKSHLRGDERVDAVIVDGGMNLYPAHALYGSYLHIDVMVRRAKGLGRRPTHVMATQTKPATHWHGTACYQSWLRMTSLVVRNAGAYARCRSTWFNERVRPGVVWVEDGQPTKMVEEQLRVLDVLWRGQHI